MTATTNRPRKRLPPEERRRELLEIGLSMFGASSYEEVPTESVAEAAGISKALMFHYFPRKVDFFIECLQIASDRLLQATEPDPMLPKPMRLYVALDAYLGFVEGYSPSYALLMRNGVGAEEAAEVVQGTRGIIIGRFVEALEVKDVRPALRLVLNGWLAFVERTSVDWLERRDVQREALLQIWTQQMMAALQAAQTADPEIELDVM